MSMAAFGVTDEHIRDYGSSACEAAMAVILENRVTQARKTVPMDYHPLTMPWKGYRQISYWSYQPEKPKR